MSVIIKEVLTKKELKKWIIFPNKLYKNNKYYVPFLFNDEVETFTKTKNPAQASAYVVSFWTKRRFLSSIHTVFCVKTENGTEVYNSSNSCTDVRIYEDIQQYIGKKKPIAVYALKKQK